MWARMSLPAPVTWVWERFRSSFRGLHNSDSEQDDEDNSVSVYSVFDVSSQINSVVMNVRINRLCGQCRCLKYAFLKLRNPKIKITTLCLKNFQIEIFWMIAHLE